VIFLPAGVAIEELGISGKIQIQLVDMDIHSLIHDVGLWKSCQTE
jgi:hypothetical protein